VSTFAHADEFEDADKAWSPGKPWPAHWGMAKYPYTEAWNVVFLGFIHKVYGKDEAADTGLKHMPSAMPEGVLPEPWHQAFQRGPRLGSEDHAADLPEDQRRRRHQLLGP